jgi:mRNA interferase MazF
VLVPFPFDDLSATKVRPAVCLTNPIGQRRHVVLAFVTSQVVVQPEDSDLVPRAGEDGFEATGLRVSSTVRLHRLMTVTAAFVERELGVLPAGKMSKVAAKLRRLFELGR